MRETRHRNEFDSLLDNAGTRLHKVVADTTEADLGALVNIHLKGGFVLTQALLPLFPDSSRITDVSSDV